MAEEKKYLDYEGLKLYNEKIKARISSEVAAESLVRAANDTAINQTIGVPSQAAVGTPGEEGYKPAVPATGIMAKIEALQAAVGEEGAVDAQIAAALAKLDKDDTAVDHQFVTAVSETDGIITVSRAALVADDIPSLTLSKISNAGSAAGADVAEGAIDAEDQDEDALVTVSQVKAFVESANEDAESRLEKVEALHATKTSGEGENETTVFKTVAEEAAEEVAKVVASAPEAFDTLKEIAEWIQKSEDNEDGFDAANRITALEDKLADLAVAEGEESTVQNAIDKAVEDEASRIDAIVGTPDTGKTLQGEIDDLEAIIGVASKENEDGEITTEATGLIKRIEDLEKDSENKDTFVAITENEIDKLFEEEEEEEASN